MFRKNCMFLLLIFVLSLSFPLLALGDVSLFWIDTSASMNKDGRFESARDVLVREIKEARPGDVLYIGHFDTNDFLVGYLVADESGSNEVKEKLIQKVKTLRATGQWTHIDEPLQASKAILLEERTPGKRRIVILSDGISDPQKDHQTVDLTKIAEIIPQDLEWSVYIIGLSEDIEGLFQRKSYESQLTFSPQYPHVKGIPLKEFSRVKIEDAVEVVKKDTPEISQDKKSSPQTVPVPWPWLLGALALATISVPLLLVHKSRKRRTFCLVLEVKEDGKETKDISVCFEEGVKKSVGPRGDIQIEVPELQLPPVVFNIKWQKETLWLIPQDSITVNSLPAHDRIPLSMGDLIRVRDNVAILIKEGGEDHVTE